MHLQTSLEVIDFTQKSWSFDTLEAFEEFVKNQRDFWQSLANTGNLRQTSANAYISKCDDFQRILNLLSTWKALFETWDLNTRNSQLQQLQANEINQQLRDSWIWSGHPFISKWQELNQTSVNIADAFFEAIVQKTTAKFSNGMDFFQGYLIAYEYLNQGKTEINKRRNSENKSLSNLRDQLVDKQTELIGKVDAFEVGVTEWKDKTELNFSEWFGKQVTHLESAVNAHSINFHNQLSNWTEMQTNLQSLYQEKLRLEPSAQYWTNSANALNRQGRDWARALVLSVLLGFITFAIFFIFWLKGEKTVLSLQNIEGVLLFATIISSYAFLLKSLSKAMFSAFHLQRVSEESALLTNLYLSLKEGKDDDTESRKIILQALFSRSETGLLSGEHGPTMPSATDFINIITRK